jgi:hypothetical protein
MPTLPSDLRNKLEDVVIEARDVAEEGALAALEALGVHHHEPYPHMKPGQRELRNHLRARARQLGDRQDKAGRMMINHLINECAYEHWHRMLFARFLAENNLLIEPEEKMAISLAEAEELAKDEGVDVWIFASRCAQGMLPQIFRPDDPLLQVSFATEHRIKLEKLLASIPSTVFAASDALGWVYQFWQTKKKKEVNESEVKIGADEISAVTRVVAPNDCVDTADEHWEEDLMSACRDHTSHQTHTSKRIKKKMMARFLRAGEGTPQPIAGYIKPDGANSYADWRKDESAAKFIVEGHRILKKTLLGPAVADYFNEVGFPTGPAARTEKWYGTLVLSYYRNSLLKGMPSRGKRHTVKHHETGRRNAVRNPNGPQYRHEPHLAFLEPAEFDEVVDLLYKQNLKYRGAGSGTRPSSDRGCLHEKRICCKINALRQYVEEQVPSRQVVRKCQSPVTPTFFRKKPFGEIVEGLSYYRDGSCSFKIVLK